MKKKISILLNVLIIILELLGLVAVIKEIGWSLFIYYTECSNILSLIVSTIYIIYKLKGKVPNWVINIKYMATCCLALTFFVVIFVLSPSYGPGGYEFMLLKGSMLYHHLLCPILAMISFAIFDNDIKLRKSDTIIALIPTFIYAVVSITLNIIKVLEGPYIFLLVYKQPVYMSVIWCVVILSGAYLISHILRFITNKKIS